jgi:hypothetical protein
MHWVLICDPERRFAPQAWLVTNPRLRPVQILSDFVRRWQMEAMCEEAWAHLGVETPRQWSDRAMARTTPAVFALSSWVTLMAAHLIGTHPMPVRRQPGTAKRTRLFPTPSPWCANVCGISTIVQRPRLEPRW